MTTTLTRAKAGTPWSTWMFTTVAGVALGAVIATPIVYSHFLGTVVSSDSGQWNNFGTFFGGVLGPILSMLAFFALVYTIFLQEQQLSLARATLKAADVDKALTQKQLETAMETQKETVAALRLQNELAREETTTAAFFELLRRQTELSRQSTIGAYSGIDLFKYLWETSLPSQYNAELKTQPESFMQQPFDIRVTTKFFEDILQFIGPYYGNLASVFYLLETSFIAPEQKGKLLVLFRAQLSPHELKLLYYWGLSNQGSYLKEWFEKYHMFRGMDQSFLLRKESYGLYKPAAWGHF